MDSETRLRHVCALLPLAADIAHAVATVYIPDNNGRGLIAVASAKPNTTFILYKPRIPGASLYTYEEPMVWRTLSSGECINGQREWAVNMDALDMKTYPIRDNVGKIIAAVSFETSTEEASLRGHNILLETAYMLLTNLEVSENSYLYRSMAARDGILIADGNGVIVYANSAAASIYKILGIGKIIGRRIYERQVNLNLAQHAIATGVPLEKELSIGDVILVERAIPIVYSGQTMRVVVTITDVTELKKKEKELLIKSAVIQEIHHRVKNNLQTIASLLRLQARRACSHEVKAALAESVNRILSISVVHEFLSQQDEEVIDVAVVVKNILELVVQSMVEPQSKIETVFTGKEMLLPSDRATTLALVINELVQNSLEHGFIGRNSGTIWTDLHVDEKGYIIEIRDNGNGLPDDFCLNSAKSLGLQIVRTLVTEDLGGRFELISCDGTRAVITFPNREGGI